MTKEELRKECDKACWDKDEDGVFDWFWSEIESRDNRIKELEIANKMYKEDVKELEEQLKDLKKG